MQTATTNANAITKMAAKYPELELCNGFTFLSLYKWNQVTIHDCRIKAAKPVLTIVKAETPVMQPTVEGVKLIEGCTSKIAAKNIRTELKAAFKGCKFSVTSDHNAIRVSWIDGPTEKAVKAIVDKYEMGNFNGMSDSYDYDRSVKRIYGETKYCFTSHQISDDILIEAIANVTFRWNDAAITLANFKSGRLTTSHYWANQEIREEADKILNARLG